MENNSANKLKKENIENNIEKLKTVIEELERDYNDAGDGDDKNRLQSKLERKYEQLNQIENDLNQLKDEIDYLETKKLIDILDSYFDAGKEKILQAYNLSLSNQLLINQHEIPKNSEELIKLLEYPKPDTETYSYREKFIGYLLLLEQQVCLETKGKLKKWAENNINNCQKLCQQLSQELDRRKQEYSPGIFLAIIQEEGNYIVKAWFNKNINQNQQESPSNWRQLTINEKYEISTDKNLSNVPHILRDLINHPEDYEVEVDADIKHIHIFLPYQLMNHPVDSWKTKENSKDYNYAIGVFYEVIIRCSERMTGSNPLIKRWKTKGKKIKYELENSSASIFHECNDDNDINIKSKKSHIFALKINHVFQPQDILFKNCIPIALWIREKLDNDNNQTELSQIIKQDIVVKDIPEKVQEIRIKSIELTDKNRIGRHLCLLWDDPNLLPPTQNLDSNTLK